MRHRNKGSNKIKQQHTMIKGLKKLLKAIESLDEVKSIIVAEIKPTSSIVPLILTVQYETSTGLKCLAKSAGAVQEVFLVSSDREELKKKLAALQPSS